MKRYLVLAALAVLAGYLLDPWWRLSIWVERRAVDRARRRRSARVRRG